MNDKKNKKNVLEIFFTRVVSSLFFFVGIQLICSSLVNAEKIDPKQQEKLISYGKERLNEMHTRISLKHGSLDEEYVEQLMAAIYLSSDAKVLEIGGNVGRNSCMIASLLNDSSDLVVVESNIDYAKLLEENRDFNNFHFHIESSAISKVPLIQAGWNTKPSDVDIPGWSRIPTITFEELVRKYNIQFNVLVADCEGALYYILKDDPSVLRNIDLVIIENDFDEINQMKFVRKLFKNNGMKCVFNLPFEGKVCGKNFYQVWKK